MVRRLGARARRRAVLDGDPGVQGRPHVGVLYDRELLGEYRQLARIGVEVVGEARHKGWVPSFLFSHRLLEEGLEGTPDGRRGQRRFVEHTVSFSLPPAAAKR